MNLSPVALAVAQISRLTSLAEHALHDAFGVHTEAHKGDCLAALMLRRPGVAGEVYSMGDTQAKHYIHDALEELRADDPILFDRDLGSMVALAVCFNWFGHSQETGHTYQKGYIIRNYIDLDADERRRKIAALRRKMIEDGHGDPWADAIEQAKLWASQGIVKPNMRPTGIKSTQHNGTLLGQGSAPRKRQWNLFRGRDA